MTLVKFAAQSASAVPLQDARPVYAYGHRGRADFADVMAASGSQGDPAGDAGSGARPGAGHLERQAWISEVQASKELEGASRPGASRRERQRADKQASGSPAEIRETAETEDMPKVRRAGARRREAVLAPETAPEEPSAELPVKNDALFAGLKAKARQQDLARALVYPRTCRASEVASAQDAQPASAQAASDQPKASPVQTQSAQAASAQAKAAPVQAQVAARSPAAPPKDKAPPTRQAAVEADKANPPPRATVRQAYSTDVGRLPVLPEDKISKAAISQVGARYRYGGESPRQGFDCSGLTSWVYAQAGMDIPRSSREQYVQGQPVDRAKLQSGDLVFFGGRKSINHVGVYINDGQFVHATSSGKGVRISHLDDGIWEGKFAGARRIVSSALTEASVPSAKVRAVKDPEAARMGPMVTELG